VGLKDHSRYAGAKSAMAKGDMRALARRTGSDPGWRPAPLSLTGCGDHKANDDDQLLQLTDEFVSDKKVRIGIHDKAHFKAENRYCQRDHLGGNPIWENPVLCGRAL
jgi:hypothetical protein